MIVLSTSSNPVLAKLAIAGGVGHRATGMKLAYKNWWSGVAAFGR